MKKAKYLWFLPVLIGIIAATPFTINEISDKNNRFAFDLYESVASKNEGNIFFSPFSISTALAMTYAGSNGSTESEMAKALHFTKNDTEFHRAYGAYLNQLEENASGNIKLRIANRLWAEKKYDLHDDYMELVKSAYNAPVEKLDFKKNPDGSRNTINKWVEQKTEDRIKDLIPLGAIDSDTRLVLTNAIYFKGDWKYQFLKEETKESKFILNDGSKIKTPFMNMTGAFDYFENETYKMIRLPYKGDKQSMVMVLPHENYMMKDVERQVDQKSFEAMFQYYQPNAILSIPKFKATLPLGLNDHLKSLGMIAAFGNAGFSKLSPSADLYISDVIHKAFIEINEEGTEAAAATAVVMRIESVGPHEEPKPKEFIADHPFLYYIIDNQTRAILFMGRMANP